MSGFWGVPFEGWLIIATFALVGATISLLLITLRSTRLTETALTLQFYLHFIERVRQTGEGIGTQIKNKWRIPQQSIMNCTNQYGPLIEVMEKLFPHYMKKLGKVFDLKYEFYKEIKK